MHIKCHSKMHVIVSLVEVSGDVRSSADTLIYTEGYMLELECGTDDACSLATGGFHPDVVLYGPRSELPGKKEGKAGNKTRKAKKKPWDHERMARRDSTKSGLVSEENSVTDRCVGGKSVHGSDSYLTARE
jgi:hypothetical protein